MLGEEAQEFLVYRSTTCPTVSRTSPEGRRSVPTTSSCVVSAFRRILGSPAKAGHYRKRKKRLSRLVSAPSSQSQVPSPESAAPSPQPPAPSRDVAHRTTHLKIRSPRCRRSCV